MTELEPMEPPERLRLALGDIVLLAGRIEHHAYDIAGILKVAEPTRLSAKAALGKVEALTFQGLPPWTDPQLTPRRLTQWARLARKYIEQRDVLFHATTAYRVGKTRQWVVTRHSLRDGSEVQSDVEELEAIVSNMRELARVGLIYSHMLSVPSPGGGRENPPYYLDLWGKKNQYPPRERQPLPTAWQRWIDCS
jgi:hypothetical protein